MIGTVQQSSPAARRTLLVCPPFFSYHLAIQQAFAEAGGSAVWRSDRASEHFAYKLAMRVLPHQVAKWSTPHFLGQLEELEDGPIDRVLVIKGEAISERVIVAMRKKWRAATLHLYLWDGSENVRNAVEIAPLFDTVATFDPEDARRFGWRHRPLFARSTRSAAPPWTAKDYDWAFVGTIHSDRHRVIDRIRKQNPELRGFVFGFVPGTPLLLARRMTDSSLWRAPAGTVGTTPLPMSEVLNVMGRARALVDVEHPNQRGLTMRTIETLLNGSKLVTTNPHVQESDLYHPSRVHVISRSEPRIPAEFLSSAFEPVPSDVGARYELSGWLREVLGDDAPATATTPGAIPARIAG
jgi:hypothetical protein